jgi:hypothetical protein
MSERVHIYTHNCILVIFQTDWKIHFKMYLWKDSEEALHVLSY